MCHPSWRGEACSIRTCPNECSGAGDCVDLVCHCNPGWTGAACALLDRRPPASKAAAAVYGMHPNVTSWGGNALLDNKTGLHHLFVTEIAGPNGTSCGLISWGSHSTIIHAVSTQGIEGPYEKKAVAVGHGTSIAFQTHDGSHTLNVGVDPAEGHNPQTVRMTEQARSSRRWSGPS